MPDMKSIARQLRDTEFLEELLEEFVVRGLGSLPGRETTITLVHLLLKYHPTWLKNPPQDYEIARLLRTSPRKIRNIRDELSYRDTSRDDAWCRQQLIEVLKGAERVQDGAYVAVQVADGLVRDYAQKLVRQSYGLFERGMNADIVKLSGETFAALVISVMPEDSRQKLLDEIPAREKNRHQDEPKSKSPIRLFIDSFASKAGEEAGKQTVDLAFTLLTGGLNKVSDALSLVKKLFER